MTVLIDMKVTAIVPAAGAGKRMKKGVRKPFLILSGKPILAHTLLRLQRSPHIDDIILIVDKADINKSGRLVNKFKLNKVCAIAAGGRSRFESVRNGLALVGKETDLVFIHDGVRPFLRPSIISKTIKKAVFSGGAVAAHPATSTIKFVKRKKDIACTPDRDSIWVARTPQVFKYRLLMDAYKKARGQGLKAFDSSTLVERLGVKIKVVLDSCDNIKITTPMDLAIGEAILKHRTHL